MLLIRNLLIVGLPLLLLSAFQNKAYCRYFRAGSENHISVSEMGMGGLTTTNNGFGHAALYNPALLNNSKKAYELSFINFGFNKNAKRIIEFINENKRKFNNFEDLDIEEQIRFLKESRKYDNRWSGLALAPFIGIVQKNVGIGIYSIASADVKIDHGTFVPSIGMRGYHDNVFFAGMGKEISMYNKPFSVGIALRLVTRKTFTPIRVGPTDANNVYNIIETAFQEYKNTAWGFGADAGIVRELDFNLFRKQHKTLLSFVIHDLIGYLDSYLTPNIKFGIMSAFDLSRLKTIKNLNVGLEIVDLLNRQGTGFFYKVKVGLESSFITHNVKVRTGLHQGYPTIGFGLKAKFIYLNYAYFTRELGVKAGHLSDSSHRFQFTFLFE